MPSRVLFACLWLCLGACESGDDGRAGAKPRALPAASATGSKPEFVRGPNGAAIAPWVKVELERAKTDGRRVLVYVGATWCEPCQRFHQAVVSGQLDAKLAGLRFLEFDSDEQHAQIAEAGYSSELIPLFAVPDAQGRGTERRIFGSVKGPGAVDDISPRLQALLGARTP